MCTEKLVNKKFDRLHKGRVERGVWRKTYITLIRNNVDSFLSQHPDGLTVVCGDFNPTSTGITEQQTKNSTGLSQLIKILNRDTGTPERCLSNRPKLFAPPLQLPKLGKSDHFTVMIKPKTIPPNQIPPVNVISKRDLRPSRVLEFGRWITQYDWSDVQEKFDLFISTLTDAVN